MAFVSSNQILLKIDRKNRSKSLFSKIYIFLIDHPKQYLTTIILGNTISLVIYGYFMGKILADFLDRAHFPYLIVLLLSIIFSAFIILITAKFLPKIILSIFPDYLFKIFSPLAFLFYWIFYPITFLVNLFSGIILKLLGGNKNMTETLFLKEELTNFIDVRIENAEEKVDSEVHFFKNALNFSALKARDCMIPRKEMIAVNIEDDIKKLSKDFIDSGFSKIIVYRDTIDNVVGYVHIFDLFKNPKSIKHILLPIEMVHETTPVQEVMNKMLKKSRTIAVVLDEYGGTSGLLTLEDIVEELFGDIEDEHDKITGVEKEIGKNQYLFSAKLPVEYLNEKYNIQIPESEEYNSLGGFVISLIGEIPYQGQEVAYGNMKIYITKVSDSKIEEIEIRIISE